jgi:hypothetical protein
MAIDLHSAIPRFSIRQLLAATAFIAAGCLGLRNASPTVVSGAYAILLAALASAGLLLIYRQGVNRAFWTGFALCGWLYLLVLLYSWSLDRATVNSNPLSQRNLFTAKASVWCYKTLFNRNPPATAAGYGMSPVGGMPGGAGSGSGGVMVVASSGPVERDFVATAHVLWALFLATCGGWFARWLYITRPAQKEPSL